MLSALIGAVQLVPFHIDIPLASVSMQNEVETHEIDPKKSRSPPDKEVPALQPVPFHFVAWSSKLIAMQKVVEMQETEIRPEVVTFRSVVQVSPFQRAAAVVLFVSATQNDAVAHETSSQLSRVVAISAGALHE